MNSPGWLGFPCSSVGKESAYNAGDLGSIPGLGRSPGEGNGNPLQYSCLENPMDCSLPGSSVHGFAGVGHDLATKQPPPPGWFVSNMLLEKRGEITPETVKRQSQRENNAHLLM